VKLDHGGSSELASPPAYGARQLIGPLAQRRWAILETALPVDYVAPIREMAADRGDD